MNYLLVSENGAINLGPIAGLEAGDSLTILIAVEKEKMASELDSHLKKLVKEAEDLRAQLVMRNIAAKVVMEWGGAEEAAATCLAREQAILLK
jgi:hypothetical protein